MKEINPKDVNASVDIVSYEYIFIEEAKSIARVFSETNTLLPDEKRLFLEEFQKSSC